MKKKSSKKTARKPAASRRVELLDCLDAMNDHCTSITTLAKLLEVGGQYPESEILRPELAANAGSLIVREAEKMKEWLRTLARQKGINA
jgi:hypothetical protein